MKGILQGEMIAKKRENTMEIRKSSPEPADPSMSKGNSFFFSNVKDQVLFKGEIITKMQK
jgi:hypothetical protein